VNFLVFFCFYQFLLLFPEGFGDFQKLMKFSIPRIDLQNLGEKAPDFSRGDESPESLFESMVYK